MSSKVNGLNSQNGTSDSNNTYRTSVITVKQGDTISSLAKKFGMKPDEFKHWAGLKSGTVSPNQKIELPTVKAAEGKGLFRIAKENGMSLSEFCSLNNISNPDTYVVHQDEIFYVKRADSTNTARQTENKAASESKTSEASRKGSASQKADKSHTVASNQVQSSENTDNAAVSDIGEHGVQAGKAVSNIIENKMKWGTTYTPEELAQNIYKLADKYYGAVGRPDFDALIDEINPRNVAEVIEAYSKLDDNKDKDSLIFTITHEIRSDKGKRQDAVLKIYDALAKAKGAPAEKRAEFTAELTSQFDSWGLVNTVKLDSIINEVIKMEPKQAPISVSAPIKQVDINDNTKVVVPGSNYPQTVSSLRQGAISAAKREALAKFKDFCAANNIKYDEKLLDYGVLNRIPKPVIDKNGNIIPYVSDVLPPKGKPNGKFVILNSGHGGYNRESGVFDVGSYTFIKKANGKYAPHAEFDKMKPFTEEMAEKLRQEGYSVIITQGAANSFSKTGVLTDIINGLENGTLDNGRKYSKQDIAFISFHADSSDKVTDKNDDSSVCYNPTTPYSEGLAKTVNYRLPRTQNTWVKKSNVSKRIPGQNGVWVLTETSKKVPAVLIEAAHINGENGRRYLESRDDRAKFLDAALAGINEYFEV